LSLRADGLLASASMPVARPMSTPVAPRTMVSAYGLRFCGISTDERVWPSPRTTQPNSALA